VDRVKHEDTGTVHGIKWYGSKVSRLLCGSRIRGRGFHDPYHDTKDRITCKTCDSALYSQFRKACLKAGV